MPGFNFREIGAMIVTPYSFLLKFLNSSAMKNVVYLVMQAC
jgi:hypothetical protein